MTRNIQPLRRKTLFREEVSRQDSSAWSGSVILMRPLSFSVYVLVSLILILIIFSFLAWGKYTRQEKSVGFVRPLQGVTKIASVLSGSIEKLHVSEGDQVKSGDPLVTIRTDISNQDGSLNNQVQEILNAQMSLEKDAMQVKLGQLKVEHKQLDTVLNNLRKRKGSIKDRLDIQTQRVDLVKEELQSVETLYKNGSIPKNGFNAKRKEYTDMQLLLAELEQEGVSIEHDIESTELAIENLLNQKERISLDGKIALSRISISSIDKSGRDKYVLSASSAGIVGAIYETEGNSIFAGKELVAILPNNNIWIAEMYLPTEAIGNVAEKSTVYMKYTAFPYQKYGIYKGKIKNISKTIVSPQNIPQELGATIPMYKILVDLDSQYVHYAGKEYPLYSGMSVSAEVTGETRTILGWILGPLKDIKRSLSEK